MNEELPPLLAAAHAIARTLPALSADIERGRRLPAPLVQELARAGLLRMSVPRKVGGPEAEPVVQFKAIEALAAADAAVGWCVMIASSTAMVASALDDETLQEIYGDASGATCGVYAPKGLAQPVPGGFKVTGTWAFASGCEHSTWRLGGALLFGEDGPRLLPNGMPDFRLMLFPAADSKVIDTWDVCGLRGTGSHDISVEDLFVPARRTYSPLTDRPRQPGALYRFPLFGFLACQVAAVGLGIARGAIDSLVALAVEKVPFGGKRAIAARSSVQLQVSQAEALVGSARAFLLNTMAELYAAASSGAELSVPQRARLRLAATHAVTSSAQAVDLMYNAGGASSIYASNPLQRQFRDVHVVTQHAMVAPAVHELVGKHLLGQEVETATL